MGIFLYRGDPLSDTVVEGMDMDPNMVLSMLLAFAPDIKVGIA